MQYLRLKKRKNRPRKDGSLRVEPIVITKTRKFGTVIDEETLSTKTPALILGAHDSGKTRWLERLHHETKGIWGAKINATPIWLSAIRPISAWTDVDHIADWWNQDPGAANEAGQGARPWSNLRAWERVDALPRYIEETGAVVFLDDAHKLSGRKLDVAKRCLVTARIWIASASQENRIPPNLRVPMLAADPQMFFLDSDAAYDATPILMWFFIAISAGIGAYELAVVLGGLKLLGSGRRASRQD